MMLIFFLILGLTLSHADHRKYIRPCNYADHKCVADNFEYNSECLRNNVKGYAPEVYTVPEMRFEQPHFNSSYIDYNVVIKGQDRCFVSEFFYNLEQDSGVLGVDCPWLTIETNRSLIYHQPLIENSYFSFFMNATYPLIKLTTYLANVNRLDMCSEYTFAYVAELPIYTITPNDEATGEFLSEDQSMLNIFERTVAQSRARTLALTFVNNALCDFGCN